MESKRFDANVPGPELDFYEHYEPPTTRDWLTERVRNMPWWAISLLVHVSVLLTLTLVPFLQTPRREIIYVTEIKQEEIKPDPVELKPDPKLEFEPKDPPKDPPKEESDREQLAAHEAIEGADDSEDPEIDDTPFGEPDESDPCLLDPGELTLTALNDLGPLEPTGPFGGRTGDGKERGLSIGHAPGGTGPSIRRAANWIARNQEPGGHWDSRKHGARSNVDQGVTGLAAMSLAGDGHVPGPGLYGAVLARALRYLQRTQRDDGSWRDDQHWMYGHAICTLACSEVAAMSRNPVARRLAQKGLDFIVSVQSPGGGFGYGGPGMDTSVTGWCIMAFKSAKVAGLRVPREAIEKSERFLVTNTTPEGWTGYRSAEKGKVPLTAAAGTCRLFLGMSHTNPAVVRAADHVRKAGVQTSNLYSTYYATILMFQMGNPYWKDWNPKFAKDLMAAQVRVHGASKGSWNPGGHLYGAHGGRVYSTAMSLMCLEVYYRYMPLYR